MDNMPHWATYTAVDKSGHVWAYEVKPTLGKLIWRADYGGRAKSLGVVECDNWRESLEEVNRG